MWINVSEYNINNLAPLIDKFTETINLNRTTELFKIKKIKLKTIERRRNSCAPSIWNDLFKVGEKTRVDFVIAGGAVRDWITSIFNKNTIIEDTDIDLFFYYSKRDYILLQDALEADGGKVSRDNERVVDIDYKGYLIQLIKAFSYNSPEHVIATFDLSASQFAVAMENNELFLYYSAPALKDTVNKRLTINQITFPFSTTRRLLKYSKKGFYVCKGVMLQAAHALTRGPDLDGLYVD